MLSMIGEWEVYPDNLKIYPVFLGQGIEQCGRLVAPKVSHFPGTPEHIGQVVYDIRCQVYLILCDDFVKNDVDLLRKIIAAFHLNDVRYDIISEAVA